LKTAAAAGRESAADAARFNDSMKTSACDAFLSRQARWGHAALLTNPTQDPCKTLWPTRLLRDPRFRDPAIAGAGVTVMERPKPS
jgi:hypothetical protein